MKPNIKGLLQSNNSGEIMLESILVIIPVLFVLVFLLCLGFYFYQHWNIQITANEVASKVAESYQYLDSSLGKGVESFDQVKKIEKYRYTFGDNRYAAANATRGENYTKKYLSLVSLAYPSGNPSIEIEKVNDGLYGRHIHVKLTATYRLPFSEGFQIFGMKSRFKYSADGYAACEDLIDYLGTVNYAANLEGILHLGDVSVYKAANSVAGMISKIIKAVDKVTH